MSNRAYLVCNDSPASAGPVGEALSYAPDEDVVAAATCRVPLLWLASFPASALGVHAGGGEEVPTLLAPTSEFQRGWDVAMPSMVRSFPNDGEAIDDWAQLVEDLAGEYVKVDCAEIWMMGPDTLQRDLKVALRMGGEVLALLPTPVRRLVGASLAHGVLHPQNAEVAEVLHGYSWVRRAPWD